MVGRGPFFRCGAPPLARPRCTLRSWFRFSRLCFWKGDFCRISEHTAWRARSTVRYLEFPTRDQGFRAYTSSSETTTARPTSAQCAGVYLRRTGRGDEQRVTARKHNRRGKGEGTRCKGPHSQGFGLTHFCAEVFLRSGDALPVRSPCAAGTAFRAFPVL